MSTYTATISNKLNNLLEKTKDAEKGFKTASENTNNTYLKQYFERKSKERYQFGYELNNEVRLFGERPKKSGSVTGAAHRTWMDIKALFSGNNDEAMLEEAISGERATLQEYNNVLNETSLPISTHSILLKQKDIIESDLKTIKTLEDLQ
ncbi:uncharacterized protein (TIGR02284 family) [Mariniflexile fucanivorans]|uniref:Uncharacterized protein (TIGR02284 family) n=1 Tax=Mariniflexile fucanivorans TaxID=264023 RepID=A0A4R1RBN5_9FLAO|nr:PA2169 family four-helix-bundle protein [Mariniflexile fucanivorans]TCL63156.1 uncharacterized protein (TIGR02284 family) [Mariniflexile fucanivorans]